MSYTWKLWVKKSKTLLCKSVHKWQFTGTVHIRTKTLRSQRYHYRHCMYGQNHPTDSVYNTKFPAKGHKRGFLDNITCTLPSPSNTASMSACLPVGQVFVVVKQLNFHNLIFINRSCHRPLEGLEKKQQNESDPHMLHFLFFFCIYQIIFLQFG